MASNSASSIFSYIRKSTDATPSYLVVHNLAQARDDFPITVSASGLAEGQYVLRDLLTDNSIGQLNVNANGSIDGTAEAVALDGFTLCDAFRAAINSIIKQTKTILVNLD